MFIVYINKDKTLRTETWESIHRESTEIRVLYPHKEKETIYKIIYLDEQKELIVAVEKEEYVCPHTWIETTWVERNKDIKFLCSICGETK
jgi:hypothetical protein